MKDDRGTVVSNELVILAVVAAFGLITSLTAIRDAAISEISDIAGSVQDLNQCYSINGIIGHSATSHGMDFIDQVDHCDDADDITGAIDNCIVLDAPPSNEVGEFRNEVFGHATDRPSRFLDSWRSNTVIDEQQTFTSTHSNPITVLIKTFQFYAGRVGGVVTPFIARVFGDNDFEVAAIGDTVSVHSLGDQVHDFSSSPTAITVAPGETIAFGFTDANPDGSASNHSVIRFDNSSNEIWYSGGPGANQAGSIAVGSAPTPGGNTLLHLNRSYQFGIGICIPE